jgi:hypothetical protein
VYGYDPDGYMDIYRVVGNGPTNTVDPSGLDFLEWLAAKIGPNNIAKLDTVLGDPRTGWFAQVTDAVTDATMGG